VLSIEREVRMTKSLLRSVVVASALALAACAGEDTQTNQRGIDQDITATHDAGAPTLSNIGQRDFAPWRFNMKP
jgi:ABC-type glycerol-3-phosphate transport system substrate-binding protein